MMNKAGMLVLLAGVAYYFAYVCERELAEQKHRTNIEMARKCSADATKYYWDFRRRLSAEMPSGGVVRWRDPVMHFNTRLNTCLVDASWDEMTHHGPYGMAALNAYFQVIDVYTGRDVITGWFTWGEDKTWLSMSDVPNYGCRKYSTERDRLLSE